MSDFRKAIGEDNPDENNLGEEKPISIDDLSGNDNLPAVPTFEEASFEAVTAEPAASASSQALGQVEEAQLDNESAMAVKSQGGKKKVILIVLVALAVAAIAVLMLSGGKEAAAPGGPPSQAPVTPSTKETAIDDDTAVDSKVDSQVDSQKPSGQAGTTSRTFSQTRVQGIITPKERAQGEKLLNQAEAWIQDADHPADGKTGKLRNDARQMAVLMSRELPFTVTTKNPKRGQVQIMLNREIGLCLLITPVGKKKIPMLRRVKIYVTGISALRDQK